MGTMKTPGVYIVEKTAFPNSVVEVATAVPAFIGYTQKADNMGTSLANKPWRITSMADYHKYFGIGPVPKFSLDPLVKPKGTKKPKDKDENAVDQDTDSGGQIFSYDSKDYRLTQETRKYLLYYSMLLFYKNGGGPCYVVSVGGYEDEIDGAKMQGGIEALVKEQEPTMVVMPEAVRLKLDNCISLQQAALAHCGGVMKNRVAILDVYNGFLDRQTIPDCIADFRDKLGTNYLDYAAAYYPWLKTTIVQDNDLSYENINEGSLAKLQQCLMDELGIDPKALAEKDSDTAADKMLKAKKAQQKETIGNITKDWTKADSKIKPDSKMEAEEIAINKAMLNKSLVAMSPFFNALLSEIRTRLNLLPPSAAMAGVYTMVDNSRGVWKAPANVSLSAVASPSVNITHDEQEDLNVTPMGKSINAIRTFIGEGTLVWGARTLDGNSLDWRYISVRRTLIMLEESIKLAAKAYVFEDNVATTWTTIRSMINNFLTGIWKRGGLAGSTPKEAFNVFVGLGETMTPEDILEGILRVTVLVAVTRPAEFIEITFQQQMQKS